MFLDNAAETRHVVFRPLSEDTDRRLWQNRWCQEAPTCAYHCVATRRTSPWSLHAEQELVNTEALQLAFVRGNVCSHMLTQRRDLKCGIRAQETGRQTPTGTAVSILQLSLRHTCAQRDGDVQ